jgi:hypothetical protein
MDRRRPFGLRSIVEEAVMNEPGSIHHISGVDARILAEHRRIRDTVRRLEETPDLGELLMRLADFRGLLVVHFPAEEAPDGFFDAIRSTAPRHLGRLEELRREHAMLLASVDAVAARVRACLAGPVAEVIEEARNLARGVRRHEAAEDELLVDSFYTDLGQGQ